MSTHTSKIQIKIVEQSLENLRHNLYISEIRCDSEFLPDLKYKINKEETELEKLKILYPEEFI